MHGCKPRRYLEELACPKRSTFCAEAQASGSENADCHDSAMSGRCAAGPWNSITWISTYPSQSGTDASSPNVTCSMFRRSTGGQSVQNALGPQSKSSESESHSGLDHCVTCSVFRHQPVERCRG